MSEAYLITGLSRPAGTTLDELLQTVYSSSGIKPGRENEIHLFTDDANALFNRRSDSISGPVITWPLIPGMEISTLFSMTRALECGEIDRGILAEVSARSSCVLLLANPKTVGKFNLSPRLRFSRRTTIPAGIMDIPQEANKFLASIPPEQPDPEEEIPDLRIPRKEPSRPWLTIVSPEKQTGINWPEDRLINGSVLFSLMLKLADAVESSHHDPGILVHVGHNEPGAIQVVLPL